MDHLSIGIFKAAVDVAKDVITDHIKNILKEKKNIINSKGLANGIQETILSSLSNSSVVAQIDIDSDQTLKKVEKHLDQLRTWSAGVNFKDLERSKKLDDIYVELDTFLVPKSLHQDRREASKRMSLENEVFDSDSNLLLLGAPGAGKTTSMKKVVSYAMGRDQSKLTKYFFPIVIRLRELQIQGNETNILIGHLSELFAYNIKISMPQKSNRGMAPFKKLARDAEANAFIDYLNELRPILILDGFDEIGSSDLRQLILNEIQALVLRADNLRIVMTCRTGELNVRLENFETFEIAPLSLEQVRDFIGKWIKDKDESSAFYQKIQNSPFADTAIKPLTLAHLCAIYERTGRIPEKPKAVYRKVVRLLLEEWDEQRSVMRSSSYGSFDLDQKYEFLCCLAYHLSFELKKYVVTHDELITAHGRLSRKFALKKEEQNLVVAEIESHTGLFVQSGYDTFEFAHKSLQEYLAAEYIVKLPSPPSRSPSLSGVPSELAVATSISSSPDEYLSSLLTHTFINNHIDEHFFVAFLSRLKQEKPNFNAQYNLFLDLISIVSLWFCCGKKLKGKLTSIPANQFISGYKEINLGEVPDVKSFFTSSEWEQHWSTFAKEFISLGNGTPSQEIIHFKRKNTGIFAKRYRNSCVLPKRFVPLRVLQLGHDLK